MSQSPLSYIWGSLCQAATVPVVGALWRRPHGLANTKLALSADPGPMRCKQDVFNLLEVEVSVGTHCSALTWQMCMPGPQKQSCSGDFVLCHVTSRCSRSQSRKPQPVEMQIPGEPSFPTEMCFTFEGCSQEGFVLSSGSACLRMGGKGQPNLCRGWCFTSHFGSACPVWSVGETVSEFQEGWAGSRGVVSLWAVLGCGPG